MVSNVNLYEQENRIGAETVNKRRQGLTDLPRGDRLSFLGLESIELERIRLDLIVSNKLLF